MCVSEQNRNAAKLMQSPPDSWMKYSPQNAAYLHNNS
jgi:hypothetical protein